MHKFLLLFIVFSFVFSPKGFAKPDFEAWLQLLKQEAIAKGISSDVADATIQHIQWQPQVISLDRKQPEFVTTFQGYYYSHITPKRVRDGRKKLSEYKQLLHEIENIYGIPPTLLTALWGLETNYGGFKGDTDVVSTLATLAYEGRREAFFKSQLFDAMTIMQKHQLPFSYLSGSWAGAFGHLQFMPSTFKRYAKDGDGNQRIDIKKSVPDALHSAANYLSKIGWVKQQPSAIQVSLPESFNYEMAQLGQRKTLAEWSQLGVMHEHAQLNDAKYAQNHHAYQLIKSSKRNRHNAFAIRHVQSLPLSSLKLDDQTEAAILLPQGWRGPAFMVFDNFHTILDWNRSINYALCVSFLANQLDDYTVVNTHKVTDDTSLSRLQMQRLQNILKSFGFDPGPADGYPGLKTQAAIRAYQKTNQLPADGYASELLYHYLDRQSYLRDHQAQN